VAERPEFVEHVLELVAPLGGVTARGMFGGWGIFCQGLMFALIAGETLYLKVDDGNRAAFEAAGLAPFRYHGRTKQVVLPYRMAPPDALDNAAEFLPWARGAFDAALLAHRPRRPRRGSDWPAGEGPEGGAAKRAQRHRIRRS
jgi:DNA transformation protein